MSETFLGDVSEVFGIFQQAAGIYTTINPPSAPAKPPGSTPPPPSRPDGAAGKGMGLGAMLGIGLVVAIVVVGGFFVVKALK